MVSLGNRWAAWLADRIPEELNNMSFWYGISKEREAKIRKAVEGELKDRIVEELTPVIREQVEHEVRKDAHKQARKELLDEADRAVPEPKERRAFVGFVKEVELDSHAQAAVASSEADTAQKRLARSRRWRNPPAYALLLALAPAAYGAYGAYGPSPHMAVVVVTMALTLFTLAISNDSRHTKLAKEFSAKRRVASDYMLVAERAKAYRIVNAERMETKKELDQLTSSLRDEKARLDRDHWPDVESVQVARDSVRHRIEDPGPRLLEDFDERLEEAAEEAGRSRA